MQYLWLQFLGVEGWGCSVFLPNSFMEHNEIQTQHWHNFQIIILVHLTWRINHNFNIRDEEKARVNIEYHFTFQTVAFMKICLFNIALG